MLIENITCFRGDTFTDNFEGTDFDNISKVYFTVKSNYQKPDSESVLQVDSLTGLLYLNGVSSASPTSASLIISSASQIDLTLDAFVTSEVLYKPVNYYYDLQALYTNGRVITIQLGEFIFTRDVTRRIT